MAQGIAYRNGTTFYAINLSSSTSNISDSVTRINWSCNVQFGNWYYWGLRLHVAVNGHEVGNYAGACSYKGQVVINVSGAYDVERGEGGRDVKVEAWTTSETVNGYGGVGTTASCAEWRNVPGISYQTPDAPSGIWASRANDGQVNIGWSNNPSGVIKKYTGLAIERSVDGGAWSHVTDLSAGATSYTDRSVSANHRYAYRVRAKNNAGWSSYATSGWTYTTPSDPSECSATRKSDTQASVSWKLGSNAPASYVNVLVERRIDEGGWSQVATLGATTTNYTDNGITANHRYQYRVRAYNGLYSGYSASGYIYTTPAAPKSVNLSKIGGTNVRITVDSASPYADGFLYQLSVNGGDWGAEQSMGTSTDVNAGGGTVRARVRAKRGSLHSAYTESGSVTTIVAPNAPTLSEFASVYALPATVRVEWTRMHPDGTEQTAAQVEFTDPNGKVETVDVASDNHADIKLEIEGEYRVRVRTKGLDPSWGAWSPQSPLHAEFPPQAFFTAPSVDGLVVQGIPFIAEWEIDTSSGVSSQEIRLLSDTGDVLHSAQLSVDARSYSFSVDTYLPQTMRDYTIVLTALDGFSLSTEARRRVSTDYAEPAIPHIEVVNDNTDMSVHITVLQGEGGWVVDERGMLISPEYWDGSEGYIPVNAGFKESDIQGVKGIGTVVPTVRLSVARLLEDGSQEMLTDDLPSGHEVIDRLPPLNVDYTYLVTAYSAAGTATTAEVKSRIDSDGCEAFNFGADASTALLLRLDTASDSTVTHGGEWFNFALGPDAPALPTFYPDGSMGATGSHSYVVMDDEDYRRIDALRRARGNAVCWYRDHWGLRYRVKADWKLSYAASQYMQWPVGVNMTECVWEAPNNG